MSLLKTISKLIDDPEKIAYKESYKQECLKLAKEKGIEDAKKKYNKE